MLNLLQALIMYIFVLRAQWLKCSSLFPEVAMLKDPLPSAQGLPSQRLGSGLHI